MVLKDVFVGLALTPDVRWSFPSPVCHRKLGGSEAAVRHESEAEAQRKIPHQLRSQSVAISRSPLRSERCFGFFVRVDSDALDFTSMFDIDVTALTKCRR